MITTTIATVGTVEHVTVLVGKQGVKHTVFQVASVFIMKNTSGNKANTNVTEFWKITHTGTDDTVNIQFPKAPLNIEFLPTYGYNKS